MARVEHTLLVEYCVVARAGGASRLILFGTLPRVIGTCANAATDRTGAVVLFMAILAAFEAGPVGNRRSLPLCAVGIRCSKDRCPDLNQPFCTELALEPENQRSSSLQWVGFTDPPCHVCCTVQVRTAVLGLEGVTYILLKCLVVVNLIILPRQT